MRTSAARASCYRFIQSRVSESGNIVRPLRRYLSSSDDVTESGCSKNYPKVSSDGFAYSFLWFCQIHGHCYNFHLTDGAEAAKILSHHLLDIWKFNLRRFFMISLAAWVSIHSTGSQICSSSHDSGTTSFMDTVINVLIFSNSHEFYLCRKLILKFVTNSTLMCNVLSIQDLIFLKAILLFSCSFLCTCGMKTKLNHFRAEVTLYAMDVFKWNLDCWVSDRFCSYVYSGYYQDTVWWFQLFLDAIEHATIENHDAYLSNHCSCLCAYKIQLSCKMCMFGM